MFRHKPKVTFSRLFCLAFHAPKPTQDINGAWIKVTHEVAVPTADWTGVNARLGTDFVIKADGTITGVEGLNINMANGEATFNFNGQGQETYHIGNMKVQEINGIKTLLVAGYAWNTETKAWEVFNPGFPMESPEAQLGWFMQADVATGDWLRFHQRAVKDIDIEMLTILGTKPDSWELNNYEGRKREIENSLVHYNKLDWHNSQVEEVNGNKMKLDKDQYPGRVGLSYGYLIDSSTLLISFDALNGDGTTVSMPMIMDDALWIEHRNEVEFTRAALASGHEWDESMVKEEIGSYTNRPENWMFWPIVSVYPDATMSSQYGTDDIAILKDPEGIARREATIKGDRIIPLASLEIWGAGVFVNTKK